MVDVRTGIAHKVPFGVIRVAGTDEARPNLKGSLLIKTDEFIRLCAFQALRDFNLVLWHIRERGWKTRGADTSS